MAVNSGQFFYNDERVPLAAELHNFHAQIDYSLLSSEYKGSLGYENGRVRVKDFNPVEHNALIRFTANRMGMAVDRCVTTGKSHVTVNGQISDYSRPSIDGKYEGMVFTEELAGILKNSSIPSIGQATTEGTFQYRDVPGQPFFDGVSVAGQVEVCSYG